MLRLHDQQTEPSLSAAREGGCRCARFIGSNTARKERSVPFIVNSSPGPGLRFEPSETLADAKAALSWAAGLERRGMRLIRIRDTETGLVFDEKGLREEIKRLASAES